MMYPEMPGAQVGQGAMPQQGMSPDMMALMEALRKNPAMLNQLIGGQGDTGMLPMAPPTAQPTPPGPNGMMPMAGPHQPIDKRSLLQQQMPIGVGAPMRPY